MSTNEGRPVNGRQEVRQLFQDLRMEVWLLRLLLRLFRWRLGDKDSWRRTHAISMLHGELCRSQNVACGMWGWADFSGGQQPIIHSASYSHDVFKQQNFDSALAQTIGSIHQHLATEAMEQLDLVQDVREQIKGQLA